MTELEYTQKQTQTAIKMEMKNVVEAVLALQEAVDSNNWQDADITAWTDGYLSRDVSKVAALLARHKALAEAAHMAQ
jgi:hypothetical protein